MPARRLVAVLAASAALSACGTGDDPFRLLGSEQWSERAAAATALGERGGRRAHGALRQAVGDPEPRVRIAVAHALSDLGEPASASDLARLLGDESAAVRLAAVEALSALGGERARAALLEALGEPDREVRRALRRALVALGVGGEEQVAELAARTRRSLAAQAGSRLAARRLEAARGLAECGDPEALEALARLAQDEEVEVAAAAAGGLGRAGPGAPGGPLGAALRDPRAPVRTAALDGLALARGLPEEAVGGLLCGLLSDREARRAAAAAVAAHRVDCELGAVRSGLEADSAEERVASAELLALVLGAGAAAGTADRDALAARAAETLWREAGLDRLVAVAAMDEQPAEVAAARLRDELEGYLESETRWVPLPEPVVPRAAEEVPARDRPAGDRSVLAELLASYQPRLPGWVELFPGRAEPEEVAGLLTLAAELGLAAPGGAALGLAAASAPHPLVRAAAVAAAEPGPEALSDPSPLVRLAAAEAMARRGPGLGGRDKAALAVLLPDPDPDVRAAAAHALGASRDPAALPPLVAAFERWPDPAVALALGDLGVARAVEPLAAVLERPAAAADPALAAAVATALGRLGAPAAADALVALLDHRSARVRAAAVAAVGAVGGAEARRLAAERRRDFALVVREAAAALEASPPEGAEGARGH